MNTEWIHGMVTGSRYRRVATVELAGRDAAYMRDVADATEAFSSFRVGDAEAEAIVRVIAPPQEPAQGQWRC